MIFLWVTASTACGGLANTENAQISGESGTCAGAGATGATGAGGAASGTSCAGSKHSAQVCSGSPDPLPESPCPVGYFYYTDSIRGPFASGGAEASEPVGDRRCHQLCETDADCSDPCRSRCHTLGLYQGGDWNCNGRVRVCGNATYDDCS